MARLAALRAKQSKPVIDEIRTRLMTQRVRAARGLEGAYDESVSRVDRMLERRK